MEEEQKNKTGEQASSAVNQHHLSVLIERRATYSKTIMNTLRPGAIHRRLRHIVGYLQRDKLAIVN